LNSPDTSAVNPKNAHAIATAEADDEAVEPLLAQPEQDHQRRDQQLRGDRLRVGGDAKKRAAARSDQRPSSRLPGAVSL
jgi:hypothetical protein